MPIPHRPFGPTGVDVPVLGQGTWLLRDKEGAREALRAGLDLGMTHVDTAELYVGSEQVVGDAIDGRRDEVFLVSKVLPRHARRKDVLAACAKTLERLRTDRLDVYLLHWPSDTVPIEETLGALGELVDDGKARFLGVSNFDVHEMEEAVETVGRHRIVCDQVLYHLGDRGIEHGVLPWCTERGIAVVAYSPFGGQGGFPREGSRKRRVLDEVAAKHGATARQVTLAFLTRHPNVFAIPKAERPEHTRENAGAAAVRLDEEDVAAIDAAFPAGKPRPLGFL